MRSVRQPGQPAAERAVLVAAALLPIDAMLAPGTPLLHGLAALMAQRGFESACIALSGGAFAPFAYVIPASSPDAAHAAFYSGTHRPAHAVRLGDATGTLGWRDGEPFLHCHAQWTGADGRSGCGHVLADESIVSEAVRVQGAGLIGARFEVQADAETGFALFVPRATGSEPPPGGRRGAAVRLAPNQDLTAALEQAGRTAGFDRAVVHGGVASLIGARFVDAAPVEGYAAEMLLRRGVLRCVQARGTASTLDAAVVDLHGTVRTGRLAPGDNPILMTFEGALEAA